MSESEYDAMIQQLEEAAAMLEQENIAIAEKVDALEAAAHRADSYRQVANAQAAHNWGYYQHLHKEELDQYWAQTVDNIVYAHGREAFFGRESTYQYYIETPKQMCANGRKNALKYYGMKFYAPLGPGYRVHNVLGSPIVEVSGDGKTARGTWMAFTFMSQINNEGGASPSLGLAKYGDEFFYENSSWKMWHRRDYVDSMLACNRIEEALPFENNVPLFQEGVKTIAQQGDMIYHPYSCTFREPAIPAPYFTWDPAQSCIQVKKDGYTIEKEDA